jgi:transposase
VTTTMMSQDRQDRLDGDVVLGVDTHKDWHVAVVATALGTRLGTASFPATSAGYAELLKWATGFGAVRRAGVEGTGSYGASLTRFLTGAGVAVTEVNRPDRANRRRRGKSDPVDAEAAAHAVISGRATAVPKSSNGPVEQIRIFKLAKDSAVKAKRQAVNQMHALLVNADPGLRERLSGLGRKALVTRCAAFDPHSGPGVIGATEHTLRTLARRVQSLDAEIRDLTGRLEQLVMATAPVLLEEYGVGVDSAATLLRTVGDNPDRIHSEAAFAALCGVSPVDMSSGQTQRHRLNRGGDRQANAALYRILLTRLRDHPPTLAYVARRTTEGKSKRRIIRCLKRYLARHLFNLIRTAPALTSPIPPTA